MPKRVKINDMIVQFDEGMTDKQIAVVAKKIHSGEIKEAGAGKAGVPVAFGGPVIPNPKNLKPQLDTEKPAILPGAPVMDITPHFKDDQGMDPKERAGMVNPERADFLPDNETVPEPKIPMRLSHKVTVREQ